LDYIDALENVLGRKAVRRLEPHQAGDVPDTWADMTDMAEDLGFRPAVPLEEGVRRFAEWYLSWYGGRA
jgi:UDP-glucuronate 4-epimerase